MYRMIFRLASGIAFYFLHLKVILESYLGMLRACTCFYFVLMFYQGFSIRIREKEEPDDLYSG